MPDKPYQYPLGITNKTLANFASFYVGPNEQLVQALKNFSLGSEPLLYLWGEQGVGKSHLLQACVEDAMQNNRMAFYFSGKMPGLHLDIFSGLEQMDMVCIDDVDFLCQQDSTANQWQEALFHFYNRALENKTQLLFSATQAPKNLTLQLADLKSRLSASVIYQIASLSDEAKIDMLKQRASHHAIPVADEVYSYLITRYARNIDKLINILDKLDKESLAQQRRITIPFVKQILNNAF